jgi:hypothetical protein
LCKILIAFSYIGVYLQVMSRKGSGAMTAKQFAKKMGVHYRTVLNWLDAGLIAGAERKSSIIGEYWEVPESALKMDRPKMGPKPRKAGTK